MAVSIQHLAQTDTSRVADAALAWRPRRLRLRRTHAANVKHERDEGEIPRVPSARQRMLQRAARHQHGTAQSTVDPKARGADGCLGPPYLYLTFAGTGGSEDPQAAINSIWKFTRDGCNRGDVLDVRKAEQEGVAVQQLRSMLLLDDGSLLVTQAVDKDSRVLHFSDCDARGTRTYLDTFLTRKNSSALFHPYGLAASPAPTATKGEDRKMFAGATDVVYVSNQNSDAVIRFWSPVATMNLGAEAVGPVDAPAILQAEADLSDDVHLPPGLMLAYDPAIPEKGGVRSMVVAPVNGTDYLFLANEELSGVQVIDLVSARAVATVPLSGCIGLYYDASEHRMYAGSREIGDSKVISFDVDTLKVVQKFTHDDLEHPSGLAAYHGELFVVAHSEGVIMRFDTHSGEYLGQFNSRFPDVLEQLLFSPC